MIFVRFYTALGLVVKLLVVYVTYLTKTEGLLWPEGLYGLPKPIDGCPKTTSVAWASGLLYQDCEDTNPTTSKSPSYHLAGFVTNDVQREFCIKNNTIDDSTRPPWPSGQYCIYQKGDVCPPDLDSGWVVWDDESQNKNNHKGTLPKGLYNNNTKMYFCCSTKGNKLEAIDLPVSTPFYLIAFKSSGCQLVRGANVTREFIYYETEHDTTSSKNDYGGAHPYGATRIRYGHTIYYCYYTPKYCPRRVNPVNGYIYPPRCTQTNQNVINDSCVVKCNPSFVEKDLNSTKSTCREDGTWDIDMITECTHDKTTTPTRTTPLKTTSTQVFTSTQHLLSTTLKHGASDSNEGTKKSSTTLWSSEVSTEGHAFTRAVTDAKMSSAGAVIAGSICIGAVALGVIIIVFVVHFKKEKAKKSSNAKGLIDKSKSLEELVSGGSIILNRTASSENLIYAHTGINEVQFFVKTDENPLYESAGATGT